MKSEIGKNIKVCAFGGSHEDHIGVTITGLPPNTAFSLQELQAFLDRRAPGKSPLSTPRCESDLVEVRSGARVFDSIAVTGADPLTLIIKNRDRQSRDYAQFKDIPRPGHADFTARVKYGDQLNMAGGGPFSGRMTACLCIAGGIALQMLQKEGITIGAHIHSICNIKDQPLDPVAPVPLSNSFPVLDERAGEKMQEAILAAKEEGDSLGGIVEAFALGCPVGLGGPMYDGAESVLSPILFGIPAVKGVAFGSGFESTRLKGSENNDPFTIQNGSVKTVTNHHGGILGGITSGMPLTVKVAFKPTPSIYKTQQSVSLSRMAPEALSIPGRHDPCIVPRAVPVVESALAIGILDMIMEEKNEFTRP